MVAVPTLSFAQKDSRVKFEYSYLNSFFFEHDDGSYATHSESFGVNRIGVSYNRKLYKWFRAETGIDFVFSDYTTDFQAIPDFIERDDKLFMLSIPMVLSVEFAKYFYVKGGISIDFQTNEFKLMNRKNLISNLVLVGYLALVQNMIIKIILFR